MEPNDEARAAHVTFFRLRRERALTEPEQAIYDAVRSAGDMPGHGAFFVDAAASVEKGKPVITARSTSEGLSATKSLLPFAHIAEVELAAVAQAASGKGWPTGGCPFAGFGALLRR